MKKQLLTLGLALTITSAMAAPLTYNCSFTIMDDDGSHDPNSVDSVENVIVEAGKRPVRAELNKADKQLLVRVGAEGSAWTGYQSITAWVAEKDDEFAGASSNLGFIATTSKIGEERIGAMAEIKDTYYYLQCDKVIK